MYLNLDLTTFYILDALINIEDGRLVVLSKAILKVVSYEAGLSHRGITNEDHLDSLLTINILLCL